MEIQPSCDPFQSSYLYYQVHQGSTTSTLSLRYYPVEEGP